LERVRVRNVVVLSCALAIGCSKTEPEPPAAAVVASKRAPLEDTSFRYPAAERIVAIGDLHGDAAAARAALRLAGAIDDQERWAGGRLVVVQTGDQLDRGDDEPEILGLLERLSAEAKAAGGALHALNGNHEVMNVQGDFRYVTEDGFRDFGKERSGHAHERAIQRLPPEAQGRAAAFLPGGDEARRLAQRPVVLQVGPNVFVHGGVLEEHVNYGLGRINREVQQWMLAPGSAPAPAVVANDRGPIWLRLYSDGLPLGSACDELGRVLDRLSAKRLIVGHTVQEHGINSACRGKVWRIDVGLSRYYGKRPPAVLEITGDQTRVLQASTH
jgi:hypothetical protein